MNVSFLAGTSIFWHKRQFKQPLFSAFGFEKNKEVCYNKMG